MDDGSTSRNSVPLILILSILRSWSAQRAMEIPGPRVPLESKFLFPKVVRASQAAFQIRWEDRRSPTKVILT